VTFEVSPVGYPFKSNREGALTPVLPWSVRLRKGSRAPEKAWGTR